MVNISICTTSLVRILPCNALLLFDDSQQRRWTTWNIYEVGRARVRRIYVLALYVVIGSRGLNGTGPSACLQLRLITLRPQPRKSS